MEKLGIAPRAISDRTAQVIELGHCQGDSTGDKKTKRKKEKKKKESEMLGRERVREKESERERKVLLV